jgi:hypothetical protein
VVGSALEGLVDSDGPIAGQQGPAEEAEGSEPDGGLADGEQPAAAQLPPNPPARVPGGPDSVGGAPTESGGAEPGGAPGRREQWGPSWVEQAAQVEAVERGDQDVAVWSGDPGHLFDGSLGFLKPGRTPPARTRSKVPVGNRSRWALPRIGVTSSPTPEMRAWFRVCWSMAGLRSRAVTRWLRRASSTAVAPAPQPISRTRNPAG